MGKKTFTAVRILLGLAFIFFGVTKFFPLPAPTLPGPALAFLTALAVTGYMIPVVGVLETLVGLMLVSNQWIPLSMIILVPIMVNVTLFNLFLSPGVALIMIAVIIIMQVYIIVYTWSHYKAIFARKIE